MKKIHSTFVETKDAFKVEAELEIANNCIKSEDLELICNDIKTNMLDEELIRDPIKVEEQGIVYEDLMEDVSFSETEGETKFFECHQLQDQHASVGGSKHSKGDNNTLGLHQDELLDTKTLKCNLCDYQAKKRANLMRHAIIHKDPSQVKWFECDSCNFKTKRSDHLRSHVFVHKDPLEWFKCHLCNYKAKLKPNLNQHMRIHKDNWQTQWFKCELCDVRTKQKSHLNRHMIVHKATSEIEWFQCNLCDYKTKHKSSWKTHVMLIHEDPSQVQWFECDLCSFKAKRRYVLKNHALVHKDPCEWFKCNVCEYSTTVKGNLTKHALVHKDPSERNWFRCTLCDYKAGEKKYLKKHMSVHNNDVKVEELEVIHDCVKTETLESICDSIKCESTNNEFMPDLNSCPVEQRVDDPSEVKPDESNSSTNFKTLATHQNSSVCKKSFKCDLCDYKAKQKSNLRRHMLIHKQPSAVEWFKCDLCNFKTKRRDYLKAHGLVHKHRSERYRCSVCGYDAKEKDTLKQHVLIHKHKSHAQWSECDMYESAKKEVKTEERQKITTQPTACPLWPTGWSQDRRRSFEGPTPTGSSGRDRIHLYEASRPTEMGVTSWSVNIEMLLKAGDYEILSYSIQMEEDILNGRAFNMQHSDFKHAAIKEEKLEVINDFIKTEEPTLVCGSDAINMDHQELVFDYL
ncbi:hypothetical protein NQ315_007384 [Exocentrus adspersus]|uniref:C2H2-type domain-containing protein n=1 Tax=Exocentrus adspersus TaxID=1586481 RepID=A0AAV8VH73_9CUCU|nr:hypothetical protein NQ315_007384 [Exocentrus adspersus]